MPASEPSSVDPPTFRVTVERLVPVTTYRREVEVLRETDDWIEAESAYHDAVMKPGRIGEDVHFDGTHPTHAIADGRCSRCSAPDNGCFKIHAPCGFVFDRPMSVIRDEANAS